MVQRILNVRVRPARAMVLISQDAAQEELLLAFEFFSRIWGGRFGQLLAVDPETCDDLTAFRLGESRPEFIYGIGLDDKHWAKATHQACQPRAYSQLRSEFVKGITQPRDEDYILVDHALTHLIQKRDLQKSRKRTLRLVTSEGSSTWSAYCAAMFGIHYQSLRKEYCDEETVFSTNTTSALIHLATQFVEDWQQSWLEVTAHELSQRTWTFCPPTIVLVQSLVSDLSLFWNLRSASHAIQPAWILAIPLEGATEPVVLQELKEWLLAFLPYGARPNYCLVTSESVHEEDCRTFGERFQSALAETPIEAVDYEPPRNRIPVVIPYEYETTWPVEISGRKLTIQPPRPKAFGNLGSSQAWFVDLQKDVKTGRAVKELQLPSSPVVYEILNGPCPPSFEHSIIPRTGDGVDCINIRSSGSKEVVNLYLPTNEEVLGEILREFGAEPIPDEKRSSYVPVIKRFGGLFLAASAFSGQSGTILTTLAKGTMTPDEIRGECRLGGGDLARATYIDRIEDGMLRHATERMKRFCRHRYLQYAKHAAPENPRLESLLEYWADRGILTRQWKIGPCGRCRQQYFVPSLNIQRRIVCTNCGHRITLPAQVPVGYCLQRAVGHAIREGVIPVALTGRFLRSMTNRGFLWLPGVKYKTSTERGDIDILACCDGWLVFCECKTLKETAPEAGVWEDVVSQFLETATLAETCQGNLVVLAAQVGEFPQAVQERIKAELGAKIPYLLLNKNDLETGHRSIEHDGHTRWFGLSDLIPPSFPERPRETTDKPRMIDMGWSRHTR
ncbi:MAG: hypothetical protein HQ582_21845 [Planctomycetes bacterium]|nr:hypothetical protein [Planctomycetota bacterium]